MNSGIRICGGCLLAVLLFLASPGSFLRPEVVSAKVYKYVDKDGNVGYTDSMQAVPEGQRKKAKVVEGLRETEEKPAAAKSPEGGKAVKQEAGSTGVKSFSEQLQSLQDAIMKKGHWKDIAVVAACIAIFMLIGRVSKAIGPKGAWTVLRILVVFGVLAYFFYSYTKGMADTFETLKKSAVGTRETIEKKQVDQYRHGGE